MTEGRPVTEPAGLDAQSLREREQLRRAAEDGERLYRKRMHAEPTIADDNRIDGILTRELENALALVERLVGCVAEAEREREAFAEDADRGWAVAKERADALAEAELQAQENLTAFLAERDKAVGAERQRESFRRNALENAETRYAAVAERDSLRAALADARDALKRIADTGRHNQTPPDLRGYWEIAREVFGRLDQESDR